MSKIALQGNASGTGTLTIAAPNTNTDYSLTLPTESGSVVVTDGTTLYVDNANDRVGIGTASPAVPLHVYKTSGRNDYRIASGSSSGEVASVQFYGTDSGAAAQNYAQIIGGVTTNTAGSEAGYLSFETVNSGSVSERFRIGSAGQFGIGGTNYGTSGQVLTSQGSGSAPVWAAPSGGKVLQVVSTTKRDTASTTSDSFVAVSGLSVSITPSSSSSKVLIFVSVGLLINSTSGNNAAIALYKDGSILTNANGAAAGNRPSVLTYVRSGSNSNPPGSSGGIYLDSPATTSSITYAVYFSRLNEGGGNAYINQSGDDLDQNNRGRAASTITVMEIAA